MFFLSKNYFKYLIKWLEITIKVSPLTSLYPSVLIWKATLVTKRPVNLLLLIWPRGVTAWSFLGLITYSFEKIFKGEMWQHIWQPGEGNLSGSCLILNKVAKIQALMNDVYGLKCFLWYQQLHQYLSHC